MSYSRPSTYQLMVYAAYGFYLLLGLAWFLLSWFNNGRLNLQALFLVLVFGVQCYHRHLLTNLILGVVGLFASIFMLLQALNFAIPAAHGQSMDTISRVLITLPLVSIVASGILVFSYYKLNFKS